MGEMRRAAMARSFGWAAAAAQYEALYRRLLGMPPARIEPIATTTHEMPPAMTDALEPAA
jgi:hypothetical protein